jgi:rubrerythrin
MPEGSGSEMQAFEAAGFVDFRATGETAAGEFHCSECGYGVVVQRQLPRCPMCSGTAWEEGGRRPFPQGVSGRSL